MAAPRILIADDQPDVLEALRLLLKPEGFITEQANSPAAALALLDNKEFDGAIVDLNYARDTTSGAEGLELLSAIQARDALLPVIVMTAWGSVDLAVEAMRRGARDFIQKPWENARVIAIVKTQMELSRALRTARKLEAEDRVLRAIDRPVFIAESPAMKQVLRIVGDVGPSDANILITGEPGTGKEVVAQTIHAVSQRSGRRLVSVNAGGLSEGVFESELFGHVRGAFTDAKTDRVGRFELADGGTLFLDEIANISGTQQARLLRVLQTGELERVGSSRTIKVDVRVISATNADLPAEVEAGRFRADLLYRLNAIEIHLPPLREHREDIAPLASFFLKMYAAKYRKNASEFDAAAMRAMFEHDWPGNVRELQHAIERAVLLAQGDKIQASDFGLRGGRTPQRLEELSLEQVEALLIRKAMSKYEGNVSKAANALGLSRSALYRRLDRYGIA
ncbi:MAG: sigma-54-dependent Fis family transcriptional regulator [Acidobacteriota bacterium]|nr:sigma-54-dependent Fis family transcriptional regulator [Acidobacteriota bacterium]